MTPKHWQLDDIALLGVGWTFGGVLVCLALGFWVGRNQGSMRGIGSGLLLWGMGNLLAVLAVAVFVYVDSATLNLPVARCEPMPTVKGQPQHQLIHDLRLPGQPAREVSTRPTRGLCPEDQLGLEAWVSVRKSDLTGSAVSVQGEAADDDKPLALMATFGILGGIATLIGLVTRLLPGEGTAARRRR